MNNDSTQKDSVHSGNSKKQRTKLAALRVRNNIRRLQADGQNSDEICKALDLTKTGFWYHCSVIGKEDEAELKSIRTKTFAHELMTVTNRLLRTIVRCNEISGDDSIPAKDRIEAERLKKETSIDIIRLLRDGTNTLLESADTGPDPPSTEDIALDEFVKFAEMTAQQKFQRSSDIKIGDR